ncbi:hypothetical protein DRN97_06115 [Methanosarcinales archaeon]|nr:MAG: hypothetical protein DRN97_06115 [Methanosarcinales archaeon]
MKFENAKIFKIFFPCFFWKLCRKKILFFDFRSYHRFSTKFLLDRRNIEGRCCSGEVAEAAEEIIKETCKEMDIEVIDKPFFRKESFTKKI